MCSFAVNLILLEIVLQRLIENLPDFIMTKASELDYITMADLMVARIVNSYTEMKPVNDRQAFLDGRDHAHAAAAMATAFGCRESSHFESDKLPPAIWAAAEPMIRVQLESGQYNTRIVAAGTHEHAWALHTVLPICEFALHALSSEQAQQVRASADAAAKYLLRYPNFELCNRGASCAGVLVLAGKVLEDERYTRRGKEIAQMIMDHCYMPDGQVDESWSSCWDTLALGLPIIGKEKTYVPRHTGPCLNYSPIIHRYMFLVHLLTGDEQMYRPLLLATEWFARVLDPMGWAKDALSVRIPNWGWRGSFLIPMLEYFAKDKPEFSTVLANYAEGVRRLSEILQSEVSLADACTLYLAARLHKGVAPKPLPEFAQLYDRFHPASSYFAIRTRQYDTLIGLGDGHCQEPHQLQGGIMQFFSPMPNGLPLVYPMSTETKYPSGIYIGLDENALEAMTKPVDDYQLEREGDIYILKVHSAQDPWAEYWRTYTFAPDRVVTEQTVRIKKRRELPEEGSFFTALVLNNAGGITLTYLSHPDLMYSGTDSLPNEFDPETGMIRRTFKPAGYFIVEDVLTGNEVKCEQDGRCLKITIEGASRVAVTNKMIRQRFTCINVYSDIVPIIKMHHTDTLVTEPGDTFDLKFTLTI